jgi:hypothetical protein
MMTQDEINRAIDLFANLALKYSKNTSHDVREKARIIESARQVLSLIQGMCSIQCKEIIEIEPRKHPKKFKFGFYVKFDDGQTNEYWGDTMVPKKVA